MHKPIIMTDSRFLSFVLAVACLCGAAAFALDPIGPPAVDLKQGQLGSQIGYSFTKMDFDLVDGKWKQRLASIPSGAGDAVPSSIDGFEAHKAYAGLEFGADDKGTLFLRLGATRATFGDSIWDAGEELDGSIDFTVGAGAKATLLEHGDLKLGVVLQASWSRFDGKLGADTWQSDHLVGIDLAEVQIAAGATHKWAEGRWIYGGPFVYYVKGEYEDTSTEVVVVDTPVLASVLAEWEYTWQIEEGPVFGFFLGAKFELTEDSILNLEYQYSSDASVFAAGLVLPY